MALPAYFLLRFALVPQAYGIRIVGIPTSNWRTVSLHPMVLLLFGSAVVASFVVDV